MEREKGSGERENGKGGGWLGSDETVCFQRMKLLSVFTELFIDACYRVKGWGCF